MKLHEIKLGHVYKSDRGQEILEFRILFYDIKRGKFIIYTKKGETGTLYLTRRESENSGEIENLQYIGENFPDDERTEE